MELKFLDFPHFCMPCLLLIVPYGIEIVEWGIFLEYLIRLLIVPYGIEMAQPGPFRPPLCSFNRTLWNWNASTSFIAHQIMKLLIVPYGIEININPHI